MCNHSDGIYRVAHHTSDFGWVDFDFACSTHWSAYPSGSANFLSAQAEGVISHSQPNQGPRRDAPPFKHMVFSHTSKAVVAELEILVLQPRPPKQVGGSPIQIFDPLLTK